MVARAVDRAVVVDGAEAAAGVESVTPVRITAIAKKVLVTRAIMGIPLSDVSADKIIS